ncbi:hypothetical protein TanjilG_32319 [Lupinus angustifolius]|uniref:Phosphatidylinositol 4-phosphate 5-kinase n=1 Tax=Lupinus angustifolius TaxID=3871 RepID=A0A4P1R0M5_LUPAN|nr:PREDICTED: phosphatidylinositol 4-phosphate 5-kinase 6-like [Lupinus angustifolius]OIV99060.1 hypothetical protein TanjilG_32319 [Lupinus angustifolius]
MNKELTTLVKDWETAVRKSAGPKKRLNIIFTPMSVAHVDDDNVVSQIVDKVLSNGEKYKGQWHENSPHGHGKCLWNDGCMYVGEWNNGDIIGKGIFSWSSGATYEGDFKSGGYMDGKGTYIGPIGDAYKGFWVMDLRHGQGTQSYPNGDFYDGGWKKGLQSGQGGYQWKNGNHYIGQWRHGLFHGNGTMIWSNGNRYDGCWEEGLPKGNGTFRWGNGSFYVGVWSNDPKEQNGTYYPSSGSFGDHLEWDFRELFSVDLNNCKVCPCEKVSIFPSHKILNMLGLENDDASVMRRRKMSVDERLSNCSSEDESYNYDGLEIPQVGNSIPKVPHLRLNAPKKQGETISKGHKHYALMLNLQLGIRHAVGRPAPSTSLDLKSSAFDPKEKVWTKFPPEGSKNTPPHPSCDFRWKDYCPVAFRALRKLFKVDPADYMMSLCGNDALRELSSPGKSGSFFYLTNDDRYMIKTMKKAEVKVFLRMLPGYYKHVRAFENTLVTKFYGLHCVRLTGASQKKVRFVIMENLFCSKYPIHRRFDLKGSTFGRSTDKPEAEIEPSTTLKDLDLNYIFRLRKSWFHEFCRQVDRDCDFLQQERIMDYSMLVGLHFREISCSDNITPDAGTPAGNFDDGAPRLSGVDVDDLIVDPSRWIKLGINMPARAELTRRRSVCDPPELVGEPTGELYDIIIFFGIIDVLQNYDISKKLEHAYKALQCDPSSISAVDPRLYSKRFRDFIFSIFVEDT